MTLCVIDAEVLKDREVTVIVIGVELVIMRVCVLRDVNRHRIF